MVIGSIVYWFYLFNFDLQNAVKHLLVEFFPIVFSIVAQNYIPSGNS